MSIDFPNAPVDNQEFTSDGRTYVYDATKGYWTADAPIISGFTGSKGATGFTGSTGEGITGITASAAEINTLNGFTGGTDNLNTIQFLSNRNKIINGNFDIWQRGTSLTASTGTRYLADRWVTQAGGSTIAPSRQPFALGQTDVLGEPTYYHRAIVSSDPADSSFAYVAQRIEDVRTLAGQATTLTFWAKADAAKPMSVEFGQIFGFPQSPVQAIGTTKVDLTTAWQKFTVTVSIPSIAGKTVGSSSHLAVSFWLDAGSFLDARTNSLGHQSGTFDIAQIQFEEGSFATPFEGRHIAQELALCQRYYQQGNFNGTGAVGAKTAVAADSGMFNSVTRFPVVMRATPTLVLPTITYINSSDIVVTATNDSFVTSVTAAAAGLYRAYSGGLDVYTASAEI